VAHAACQHDHVLALRPARGAPALRLVDYDAMYVPARQGCQRPEPAPHYQHPQRLWLHSCDAEADRFAHLSSMWRWWGSWRVTCAVDRHDTGDNLLFKESDFQEPATSAVFRDLWRRPSRACAPWSAPAARGTRQRQRDSAAGAVGRGRADDCGGDPAACPISR